MTLKALGVPVLLNESVALAENGKDRSRYETLYLLRTCLVNQQKMGVEMNQDKLMLYDPANGSPRPYPSHAAQWREYHGRDAWLFNPWTGTRRSAGDVGSDVSGLLIDPGSGDVFIERRGSMKAQELDVTDIKVVDVGN